MSDSSFYKQHTLPDIHAKTEIPSLPERIGPYKVEALLSQGGMSLLYLGVDKDSKKPIAIKVLSPKYVANKDMVERFLKEASIIKMANHPNIVKLYGQGQWEGGVYIAMQLVRGISLRQFILQQSLSLRRSLDIILQVAYALCHLHTYGVIHGDLKPENILIEEDGEIKVVDFGIAQLFEEQREAQIGPFAGTPNYMSPEYKESPSKLSFLSDIYALGIIAYELVLGRLSYGVLNLTLIPPGLRKILEKCLAVSTEERYQDIVDFITDISQYLKSGEINKDKPGSDQAKELTEEIFEMVQKFTPPFTQDWPIADIGVAKNTQNKEEILYSESWKLPNNTLLTILAYGKERWVEASFNRAILSGMCQALVALNKALGKLDPVEFLQKLQTILQQNPQIKDFSLALLYLDPLQDQLTFISCEAASLGCIASGSRHLRLLSASNPPFNIHSTSFNVVNNNWNIGDVLVLNNLPPEKGKEASSLYPMLSAAIEDSLFFSPQRQAEILLKKLTSSKTCRFFMVIQRIA